MIKTLTPRLPSSIAADSPAGPPPRIRTGTEIVCISRSGGSSFTSGSFGSPLSGATRIPGFTSVMHDFTGIPSAITMHWAHWPLAQNRPCGEPSRGWWPKIRIPFANSAAAIVSPG